MNTHTPFFILSAARAEHNSIVNHARHETLMRQLQNCGHAVAQVNGCYKGEKEAAILVVDDRPYNAICETDVLRLARAYGQESVLAVDANGRARLIYCDDGSFETIGTWRGTNEKIAKSRDAWTERAGQYYIVQ